MKTLALAAAAAALGLAAAFPVDRALADAPAAKPQRSCFFSRDWSNWRAPNDHTIYLRVNVNDIYQVDLASGSQLLTWPNTHLVNEMRGTDSICSPIDLDLKIVEDGVMEPLFVKSITKLTREQVAAIPKKFLP
jgi:hypothetical protein